MLLLQSLSDERDWNTVKTKKALGLHHWPLAVSLIRHHLEYGCLQKAQEIAECVLKFHGRQYGPEMLPWAAFLAKTLDELGARIPADILRSEVCEYIERPRKSSDLTEWKKLLNMRMEDLLWRISQYYENTKQGNRSRYYLRERPIKKMSTNGQAQ